MIVRSKKLNEEIIETYVDAIFYMALIIELIIVLVDKSCYINPFEGKLFQLTFALCILKISLSQYNFKEWLTILIFLLLGFFCYKITGRNDIIRFIAFIAASKGIDRNNALKICFFVTAIGVCLLIVLSLFAGVGVVYIDASFGRVDGIQRRYCLGIGNPNALHCMFWALLTLGSCLFADKLKLWDYVIIMMLNYGLFVLTDSRTGFIVSSFVIVCSAIYTLHPNIKDYKCFYILSSIVLLLCILFSIDAATYNGFYDANTRPIMAWIDAKMTGRIFEGGVTGAIDKWSLFSDSEKKGYIDMGYIKMFHWYGIVPTVLYFISIFFLINYCYNNKNIKDLLLITSFNIYTLAEAHAVSPYFGRNYLIMLFIGVWTSVFYLNGGKETYFWKVKNLFDVSNLQENKDV